jgi:hypothetical protein
MQASLTTLAAEAMGWKYQDLIINVARQAKFIGEVIKAESV